MVRPMVHSIKHYVQVSLNTVAAGVVNNVVVADAVALDAVTDVDEVREGSSIKAIYFEMWIRSSSTTASSGQTIFWKKISDESNPTSTDMAALGDWHGKSKIFHTFMGLINEFGADAISIHRGWLRIPKGKQRMPLGSRFVFSSFVPTTDSLICGFFTYKEYT